MTRRTTMPTDTEDVAVRDALIVEYAALRVQAGISQREVARVLNVCYSTPYHFETRRPSNPLISSLVRYGEILNVKPVLTLHGLHAPVPAAVGPLLACGYVGAAALAQLIAARQHLGITRERMSLRAGLTPRAVGLLERDDHEPHLATLQGYARALGGRLSARWEAL